MQRRRKQSATGLPFIDFCKGGDGGTAFQGPQMFVRGVEK
jgi:hypothetical protein